ncbi:MAG: UDP-3-O-acyl-N-acetylglucosamine deacetylase, partial [Deinococcota bacterium]|nr:UDP-3-O-acyl-N-acetylglucosamine deacetylase [Deinococcota bacterium]
CGSDEDFPALATARTFGFLGELGALRARGLASAASLDNALVFTGEGSLTPLRFADEPVRHKALDALGDLFLLGRPLHATISIARGSHKIHSHVMRDMLAWEREVHG